MREGKGDAVFGGASFDDPDWTPGMLLGQQGKSGGPAGIRTGKDGLPIVRCFYNRNGQWLTCLTRQDWLWQAESKRK